MAYQPNMTMTHVHPDSPAAMAQAAEVIRAGGLVAVPTETVYGLAADARNDAAVAAIYTAKGRPSFNPLIVHVLDDVMAGDLAVLTPLAQEIARLFWPGPLTMVLPLRAGSGLSPHVTAGLPTVAIRVSAHPVMRALIRASGAPIAAPSANASGAISPTSAAHVLRSLDGRIPLILDGGDTQRGLESTIIAPESDHIRLLRPGPITPERIGEVSGIPVVTGQTGEIEAPGQLLSHYAPSKPLRLNAPDAHRDEYLIGFGAMACDFNLSGSADLDEAARRLFAALHSADTSKHPRIAIAPIPAHGIGLAINDRLARAAA